MNIVISHVHGCNCAGQIPNTDRQTAVSHLLSNFRKTPRRFFLEMVHTSLELTSQLVLPAYRILTPELGFVC